ncbi:MAG: hypothetical protein KIS66_12945 [Fimbriimonadaceae bacterium]|nr:hypothetical protein [Fimbriimonadaceae bacterium]
MSPDVRILTLRRATVASLVVLAGIAGAQPRTVWAWGGNANGQLGDGTNSSRPTPVRVPGLASVIGLSAGGSHSLVLRSDGSVWAWGANAQGQLGDGTQGQDAPTPIATQGLADVRALAAGVAHSLAVRTGGTAWGWGDNEVGQLGDGTNSGPRTIPVTASGIAGAVAITGGIVHTLVLLSDGSVQAYGRNQYGQLGDGTNADRWTPVTVSGLEGVVAIAASHHSLALRADGTVWAWGRNLYGQLGDGTTVERWTPARIPGLFGVVAVACGEYHSLALRSDGTVWAWGRNLDGQLGDGTRDDRYVPTMVPNLNHTMAIAAGYDHSLAIRGGGAVWAWGRNAMGQLGDGTTEDRDLPISAGAVNQAISVAGGQFHSLALEGEANYPVCGIVTLADHAAFASGRTAVCQIRVPGTLVVLETHTVTLGAGGYFLIPSTRVGTYDVAIKASHWLRTTLGGVTIGATGTFGVELSLRNGDVNDDNTVNIGDFLTFRPAFGSTPANGNWNPNADLNGDGTVDIADFLVLRMNFGRTGDR